MRFVTSWLLNVYWIKNLTCSSTPVKKDVCTAVYCCVCTAVYCVAYTYLWIFKYLEQRCVLSCTTIIQSRQQPKTTILVSTTTTLENKPANNPVNKSALSIFFKYTIQQTIPPTTNLNKKNSGSYILDEGLITENWLGVGENDKTKWNQLNWRKN